jgi:phosphoenolpyruvate-protein phosphotransferase (PTS system enzyme I)
MNNNSFFSGNGVVPGIAIGRAFVFSREFKKAPHRHIEESLVQYELNRFKAALNSSHNQLETIKEKLGQDYRDPGHILEAHQMMFKDEELNDAVQKIVKEKLINVEWALSITLEKWEKIFLRVDDEYLKERFSDLQFVTYRLLRNLSGEDNFCVKPPPDAIVVAKVLSPAETINLGKSAIQSIVTERGGRTSHTVIIAKSFEIPTVIGVEDIYDSVATGDLIIVDGIDGVVVVNPDATQIKKYRSKMHKLYANEQNLISQSFEPAITLDKKIINIYANVDFAEEAIQALSHGAEGIGLYRTEFLFISLKEQAQEEEQHFEDALKLFESWGDKGPITVRTFDLGGDKFPLNIDNRKEANPALGLRSLRLALKHRVLFKAQIRGILRAFIKNPHMDLRIMFPFVGSLTELINAKEVYYECYNELHREGFVLPKHVQLGTMLELPAALMITDILAKESDFFSIGTNDLTQYSLAVDRGNESIADLYNPLHPGILRLMDLSIKSAKAHDIPIAICGDMATEPIAAFILMGLGIEYFSIPPAFIPLVKRFFRSINYENAKTVTREAITLSTSNEVRQLVLNNIDENLVDEIWGSYQRD